MKVPTLQEVRSYWTESSLAGTDEEFFDHFTANGWMVGKVPMKNWQAAARNWSRNELKWTGQTGSAGRIENVRKRPEPSGAEEQRAVQREIQEAIRLRKEHGL